MTGSEAVGRRKMQKTWFFPMPLYDFCPVEPTPRKNVCACAST